MKKVIRCGDNKKIPMSDSGRVSRGYTKGISLVLLGVSNQVEDLHAQINKLAEYSDGIGTMTPKAVKNVNDKIDKTITNIETDLVDVLRSYKNKFEKRFGSK